MNHTRLAVVTGGSKGIGFATAASLVSDGHRVVITGRSLDHLMAAQKSLDAPDLVEVLQLDATDHVATHEALVSLKPDILVANVGTGFSGTIQSTSTEDWARVLDTNVTTAFTAIRAVVDGMLARSWGRIVTIGSLASHRGIRYGVAYTASKHALLGLTRSVAADLDGTGVTCNMVAPAFVRTEMTTRNAERMSTSGRRTVAEAEADLGRLSTLGRLLEPEEVAHEVVAFVHDGHRNGHVAVMGDSV